MALRRMRWRLMKVVCAKRRPEFNGSRWGVGGRWRDFMFASRHLRDRERCCAMTYVDTRCWWMRLSARRKDDTVRNSEHSLPGRWFYETSWLQCSWALFINNVLEDETVRGTTWGVFHREADNRSIVVWWWHDTGTWRFRVFVVFNNHGCHFSRTYRLSFSKVVKVWADWCTFSQN